ncbi:aromatic ring-hydroxylating dioxygenase subunit alpha [Pigmentiphaga sp. GD03639]|uniref:aromatic ring-hydroxylating dioxygenase subunit alpha n=1 Tax=Pigmentiphaga sp. GD03639 TaxID=2975354 RepID=UPI0024470A9F|nr:aromatic ring-hydroxylating dioxygenase subunit alpha [Pigmentiphaga sp. GD03639]MDH2236186.1 aromatic ring-hydroxylating dioxygenase subunit alpha [Pigmentiphaga sp. GD03639]
MLSEAKNRQLTQVGPGTPMGELLRRYWHPIAAVSEFDKMETKPVRLLGEDLVLYKDLGGNFGLIDRRCAHRRADLSYGFVEQSGLRCNYHGWLFDRDGRCTEQPYEDIAAPHARMKERLRITAYPVEQKAGMLWAYLGPQPAPLVPNWEPFTWKNGFAQIVISEIPCNWLQCQENSIDPVHFEWMHSNWSIRLKGETGPYAPTHIKVDFEEFDYGIIYKRLREDTSERHPLWTVGRVCLWPQAFCLGDHIEWRIPIDDENTLSIAWAFSRVPKEQEPYEQGPIPAWHGPVVDPDTGRWISSHVMNQDFVAWVGQGTIADRTKENLASSDRGIAMLRKRFGEDMDAVADGRDPSGLIRDPAVNECVELPIAGRHLFTEGLTREQLLAHPILGKHLADYPFQAGQPDEVKAAYRAAMGLRDEDVQAH